MSETCHQNIGRYEVREVLGHGAMGIVYKARDPQLDRTVAIKAIRPDLGLFAEQYADFRRRFRSEAMAAGRLNHPNIVAIYDVMDIDEAPFIVMEYVEGQTLARLMAAEGPLPPRAAVGMIFQVCHALEYAHARGVVHRDIKPANILVASGGEVKVSDFGIARIAGKKMTQPGALLGSPSYMSPEQVRGAAVDGRSDLFSLGVVLYEALSGADPFSGESPSTVLYNIVHADPITLRGRDLTVPPALDAAVGRALAKDPGQRYPTARAFSDALARALEAAAGGTAASSQRTMVLPGHARRPPRRVATIGAVALLGAAAGGAALWARWSGAPRHMPEGLPGGPAAGGKSAVSQDVGSLEGHPTASFLHEPGERLPGAPRGARERDSQEKVASPSARNAPELAGARRAGRTTSQRVAGLGSIRITTNASVEVLVDGVLKGRATKGPFLLSRLPVGERLVALRLGPVEQKFRQTVREGETLSLSYYFPDEPR